MASTQALGPVITAVLAALRASVTLTTYVGVRVYPDSDGDVPAKPVYPYVQVESLGEDPENTLGGPSLAKWGSHARIAVRVGSQSRSDAQANAIVGIIKGVLEGQALTVAGYATADVAYDGVQPMRDTVSGVTTREWIALFDVLVHQ